MRDALICASVYVLQGEVEKHTLILSMKSILINK